MIKKTITFADLDGNDVTRDFYFNMTKAELTEKELSYPEGYANYLQRIVKEDNRPAIIAAFKDLILNSVGVRSEDGQGFNKKGVADAFEATEAYSALFMELVTETGKAVEFFNGVMPKDLAAKMAEASIALEKAEEPKERTSFDEYTDEELLEMSQNSFDGMLSRHKGNVPMRVLQIAMRRPRG